MSTLRCEIKDQKSFLMSKTSASVLPTCSQSVSKNVMNAKLKDAEAATRAKVMQDSPDVSERDLKIKVSNAVWKATQNRIRRGGVGPHAIPGDPYFF